jgi:hypothetical protein
VDLPNGILKAKLKSSGDKASPCFREFEFIARQMTVDLPNGIFKSQVEKQWR